MSEQKRPRPVTGVAMLIWRGKKILLGERLTQGEGNCWQFPGGHLENNESVSECARREVQEETGLSVTKLRHLGFTDMPFELGQNKYLTLLVSCEYDGGEAEILEPEKCSSWQWFDYQKLPAPLFLPISNFLSQLATSEKDLHALHCDSLLLPEAPLSVKK